jgi:hypothetical protein
LLNGRYLTLDYNGFDEWSAEELQQLAKAIKENWEWAWMTSVDPTLDEVTRLIESGSN